MTFDTSITVRNAEESDYPEIVHISIRTWKQAYKGIVEQSFLDNISFDQRLEGRLKWMREPKKYSLVAIADKKIIGFCDFGISSHSQYGKGEVYAIYILPEYQGKGAGKKLMGKAMQRLEEETLTPFIIIALDKNTSAQKFYKDLGFHFLDRILTKIGGVEYSENVYLNGIN